MLYNLTIFVYQVAILQLLFFILLAYCGIEIFIYKYYWLLFL
jgi:hypothetical protein